MPSIADIALKIASNVVSCVVTFLVAFVGFIVFRLSKQRRLFNFIGVDKEARRVVVYLSSLFIPRGCAVDFDGLPRSYQGIAIPTEELGISARLSKALTIDVFENIPPIIRKSLQKKCACFRPLTVSINASPMQESEIDFSTRSIITAGSQGYNVVTNYCISRNIAQLQISHDGKAIQIMKGKDKGEVIRPASDQHDIAILERLIDHTRNDTTIIIGAGLGVIGTMGAIQYLIDHWQELNKTYHNREFALVLQFGPVDKGSLEDILKGTVIRRIPEK